MGGAGPPPDEKPAPSTSTAPPSTTPSAAPAPGPPTRGARTLAPPPASSASPSDVSVLSRPGVRDDSHPGNHLYASSYGHGNEPSWKPRASHAHRSTPPASHHRSRRVNPPSPRHATASAT